MSLSGRAPHRAGREHTQPEWEREGGVSCERRAASVQRLGGQTASVNSQGRLGFRTQLRAHHAAPPDFRGTLSLHLLPKVDFPSVWHPMKC